MQKDTLLASLQLADDSRTQLQRETEAALRVQAEAEKVRDRRTEYLEMLERRLSNLNNREEVLRTSLVKAQESYDAKKQQKLFRVSSQSNSTLQSAAVGFDKQQKRALKLEEDRRKREEERRLINQKELEEEKKRQEQILLMKKKLEERNAALLKEDIYFNSDYDFDDNRDWGKEFQAEWNHVSNENNNNIGNNNSNIKVGIDLNSVHIDQGESMKEKKKDMNRVIDKTPAVGENNKQKLLNDNFASNPNPSSSDSSTRKNWSRGGKGGWRGV